VAGFGAARRSAAISSICSRRRLAARAAHVAAANAKA